MILQPYRSLIWFTWKWQPWIVDSFWKPIVLHAKLGECNTPNIPQPNSPPRGFESQKGLFFSVNSCENHAYEVQVLHAFLQTHWQCACWHICTVANLYIDNHKHTVLLFACEHIHMYKFIDSYTYIDSNNIYTHIHIYITLHPIPKKNHTIPWAFLFLL